MSRALKLVALLGWAIAMAGCEPPNVALISTSADPSFSFRPPADVTASVIPMREDKIDATIEPTLDEKVLVDDVQLGLSQTGFRLVNPKGDTAPDFVFFCQMETRTEIYDTYDRVPVSNTYVGTRWTRGGYRTYYETSYGDVVVPARRSFTYTVIYLAAVPGDKALDPSSKETDVDMAAVWDGTIEANGPLVTQDRAWQVERALVLWGQTGHARLQYPPPKK